MDGVDEGVTSPRVMAMLRRNQGQLLLCDGSAMRSRDSDLGVNGKVVEQHRNTSGGTYKGPASYQMFSCQPAGNAAPSNNATPPPVTLADFTGDWIYIAGSDDGTKVTAATWSYGYEAGQERWIYHSTDGGATWRKGKKAGPYGWRSVVCSANGMTLAGICHDTPEMARRYIQISTDFGATWRPTQQGVEDGHVCMSEDGMKLASLGWNSPLVTSFDGGRTWQERMARRDWNAVACSRDGRKVVAASTHERLYTSTDSGVTWTGRETNRGWQSVGSSADGTKLVATARGGYVYTSSDSGVTWTRQVSGPGWGVELGNLACSNDGRVIIASDKNANVVHISADFGVTWKTSGQGALGAEIWPVFTSVNGQKLVAGEPHGSIWYSTDGGATWAKGKLQQQ